MADNTKLVWESNGTPLVNSLTDFIRAVDDFRRPRPGENRKALFRGASNVDYKLVPSLPRAASDSMREEMLYHIEDSAIEAFRRKSHLYVSLGELPPREASDLLWLQFMQHHGVKTRLLDWSSSPYVAAYFAVESNPNSDGVVWMVEPSAHVDRMREMYPDFPGKFEKMMIRGSLSDGPKTQEELDEYSGKLEATRKERENLLTFLPCSIPNSRMAAQRGWFSCSALIRVDHEIAIANAFTSHKNRSFAQKIVFAKGAKPQILRDLWDMNITGETLFPGLDGLGKSMAELSTLLLPSPNYEFAMSMGLLGAQSLGASLRPTAKPFSA